MQPFQVQPAAADAITAQLNKLQGWSVLCRMMDNVEGEVLSASHCLTMGGTWSSFDYSHHS